LASESSPPACAVQTLELEVAQRQREEINTLYVAMTRARTGLAVSSIEPAQPNEQSWWARLSEVQGVAESSLEHAGLPSDACLITSEAPFLLPELPAWTISARAIESTTSTAGFDHDDADADDNVDSASARVGKAMHRLLEWGDASDVNLGAAAREFELSPSQALEAQSMAQRILQGEGAWAWDEKLINWQGDEVALMYQGALLRIDRLVQLKSNQEWWVLDYKSRAAPQNDPELVVQLARYREAVRVIYPGEVVKAAFLTGQGVMIAI
jgi:ATP-dependent helicase/nuclease subunit A